MATIRVLNYLPRNRDGSYLDNGIDIWTWLWNPKAWQYPELRCSHTEIWIPGEDGFGREGAYKGACYSSTMRGEYDGVCRRSASSVLHTPERWTYFELDICDRWYRQFVDTMDNDVRDNQGYDIATILSFFTPRRWGSKQKYICSERCHLWILPYVDDKGKLFRNLLKLSSPSPLRLA